MNKLIIVVIVLLLAGCREEQKDKDIVLLTEKIQYDVPIKSVDENLDWWVQNLVGPQRDKYIEMILEKAYSGEIQAYDYFNEPISPEEIKKIGIDTIYQTLMRETPPYDEYDTMVITKIDHRDVTKVRFLEEWTINEKTLEMDKKILGIAPIVMVSVGGQEYNMPLFWFYFEEGYPRGF